MSCLNVLHADAGKDVARLSHVDFRSVIRVHFHHSANALGFAGGRIEDGIAFLHHA